MWAAPRCLPAAPEERPLPAGGEGAANSLRAALHREGAASHLTRPGWEKGRGFLSRFGFTVPLAGMEKSWELPFGLSLWAERARPRPAASQGLLPPRTGGSQHGDTSSSSAGLQAWLLSSVQGPTG